MLQRLKNGEKIKRPGFISPEPDLATRNASFYIKLTFRNRYLAEITQEIREDIARLKADVQSFQTDPETKIKLMGLIEIAETTDKKFILRKIEAKVKCYLKGLINKENLDVFIEFVNAFQSEQISEYSHSKLDILNDLVARKKLSSEEFQILEYMISYSEKLGYPYTAMAAVNFFYYFPFAEESYRRGRIENLIEIFDRS